MKAQICPAGGINLNKFLKRIFLGQVTYQLTFDRDVIEETCYWFRSTWLRLAVTFKVITPCVEDEVKVFLRGWMCEMELSLFWRVLSD